ncbi:MAG: ABC transporter substrate-binding protein [Nitrospira sp.]|nr:ABC transporter substrate-binding protein [Nitrospira sp.]
MRSRTSRTAALIAALTVWLVCGMPSIAPAAEHRVTDMAGRTVLLPDSVEHVAAIGPVPVIHSFILTMGKSATIVNGLPLFAQGKRYDFHRLFAPNVATQPITQGSGGEPDIERLLELKPQVIFVMDKLLVEPLARRGFTVVFLAWRQPDDIRVVMTLLGEIFHTEEIAREYLRWCDDLLERINAAVKDIVPDQRPRVLFASIKGMQSPHLIGDWWIQQAGGVSVTAGRRLTERVDFSLEDVLRWNPDVLVVSDPGELKRVLDDPRWAAVQAVRSGRMRAIPIGAHPWGYRTAEQPLMVLWAAKFLYEDRLSAIDLIDEMRRFYARFFKIQFSDDQLQTMLSGAP